MSQAGETFFTVVGCMDGRIQDVVASFGREKFGATYPDTITEAGLVGLLARENPDKALSDSLQFKIAVVSVGKHHAKGIIVAGHAECAGNPVDDQKHKEDIRTSVIKIREMIKDQLPVIGVFVKRNNDNFATWEVEEVV